MIEVIYRIYQVADPETTDKNMSSDLDYGLYSSTSKAQNIELLMDCLLCDNRDQFKSIIRDSYGNIPFKYSKNLSPGNLYCIIIGEHCYNVERYFNKVTFKCACCGSIVETYYGRPICFSDHEIKYDLYGCTEYLSERFCSDKCKQIHKENIRRNMNVDKDDRDFYITRDMFNEPISGYIYKITKKSTGEFYVGQTRYAPVFRWGEHLKSSRFPISDILDYKFETIEVVSDNDNILEREKFHIQQQCKANPDKCLNIMCTAGLKGG